MYKPNYKNFLSSPVGTICLIGFLILTVEFLIMVTIELVLKPFLGMRSGEIFWEFLDPLLLVIFVTPGIYVLAVRPLKRQQEILQQQFHELSISAVTFESQEGVVVTDTNNNILKVNHSFSEITGYSSQEATGQGFLPQYVENSGAGSVLER